MPKGIGFWSGCQNSRIDPLPMCETWGQTEMLAPGFLNKTFLVGKAFFMFLRIFSCVCLIGVQTQLGAGAEVWWTPEVAKSLELAGANRAEWEQALGKVDMKARPGMAFLVTHMPETDLKTLKATYLLNNVALAYQAREKFPWAKSLPENLFLNEVLPYASVSESRDDWRKELMDLCTPMVKDAKTITEAAQAINAQLFRKVNVKYSTKRNRADQGPKESMATGLASCTGLSILLVDACRSVGIPARVVGIPMWVNKRGNHTWVEIWDGQWHFTGACEHDANGLDRAWFIGDAILAQKDVAEHSIYASSYKRTGTNFPLVWRKGADTIPGENVTERYNALGQPKAKTTRLMIRVRDSVTHKRVALGVTVLDSITQKQLHTGKSKDESADTNDFLTFEVKQGNNYLVGLVAGKPVEVGIKDQAEWLVDLATHEYNPLSDSQKETIRKAAMGHFNGMSKDHPDLDKLLISHSETIRALLWESLAQTTKALELKNDMEKKQVRHEKHLSPYTVKTVGKRPRNGWPLFIAMHGGGGAPQEVNDSQWRHMQIYYKDQPSVEGYQYVALRAPNNVWNGFYDDYVCPLVINLIEQFTLFHDIDPDRVHLMGYSHGGYGAFFLGPKIPDRFAAIHASASAKTDGTISPRSLRNTPFSFMIGEKDTAYGRRERCERFNTEIEELKKGNPGFYPVLFEYKAGFGHGGLPDRDKIRDMYPNIRNPKPSSLTWDLTDGFLKDHFWIHVDNPARGMVVEAKINGNMVTLITRNDPKVTLYLDPTQVDVSRPVEFVVNGKSQKRRVAPLLSTYCQSMAARGDARLSGSIKVELAH